MFYFDSIGSDSIRSDPIAIHVMSVLLLLYLNEQDSRREQMCLSVSSDLTWWLVSKLLSQLVSASVQWWSIRCPLSIDCIHGWCGWDIDIYFGIGIDLHDTGVVLSALYTTCIYVQYSMHRYIQPVAASQLVSQFMIWIYLSMDIFCSIQFNSTYAIYVNWFNLISAIMYATHLP